MTESKVKLSVKEAFYKTLLFVESCKIKYIGIRDINANKSTKCIIMI